MADKTLISRIINLREARNWKQAELARKIGLEKSAMNKIENGTRKVSTEELQLLSSVFDVTTDYLLGNKHTPKWATKDDVIELDKILESDAGMAYGDMSNITKEDREQINDLIASYFWRKKQKEERNKR